MFLLTLELSFGLFKHSYTKLSQITMKFELKDERDKGQWLIGNIPVAKEQKSRMRRK